MEKEEIKRTFCEKCRKETEYTIKQEVVKKQIKNIKFEYPRKYGVCKECGSKVYIPELWDESIANYRAAYSRAKAKSKQTLTLSEWVQLYIEPNKILNIRTKKRYYNPENPTGIYWEYPIVWHGMEWQTYELDYCNKRGLEICPYKDITEFKVEQFSNDIADLSTNYIDIVIKENPYDNKI